MAEIRMVNTMLWQNEGFQQLADGDQLMLIFLLTCPSVTYYGALKAVPELLAVEMGKPVEWIKPALDRLEAADHIYRHAPAWIVVNDFPKMQMKSADARPELSKNSRKALDANKYEMPPAVLQRIMANWHIDAAGSVGENPTPRPSQGHPEAIQTPSSTHPLRGKSEERIEKEEEGKQATASSSTPTLNPSSSESQSGSDPTPSGSATPVADAARVAIADRFVEQFNRVFGQRVQNYETSDTKRQGQLLAIADRIKPGDAQAQIGLLVRAAQEYEKEKLPDAPLGIGNIAGPRFLDEYLPAWLRKNASAVPAMLASGRTTTTPPAAPKATDESFRCPVEQNSIERSMLRWVQGHRCAKCSQRCSVADIRLPEEPSAVVGPPPDPADEV